MNAFERLIRRALQQIDPNRAIEGIIDEIVHLINIPGRLAYQRRLRVPQHVLPRFRPEFFWEWLPGWYYRIRPGFRFERGIRTSAIPYLDDRVPALREFIRTQRMNPIMPNSSPSLPGDLTPEMFRLPGN